MAHMIVDTSMILFFAFSFFIPILLLYFFGTKSSFSRIDRDSGQTVKSNKLVLSANKPDIPKTKPGQATNQFPNPYPHHQEDGNPVATFNSVHRIMYICNPCLIFILSPCIYCHSHT